MDRIINILEDVKPGVDFSNTNRLIDDGILDSFDIVILVGELNDAFSVHIGVEDLVPENFNSVEDIHALITRLKE